MSMKEFVEGQHRTFDAPVGFNTDNEYRIASQQLALQGAIAWNDSVGGPLVEELKIIFQMVGYLPTTGVNRSNPSRLRLMNREAENNYFERRSHVRNS